MDTKSHLLFIGKSKGVNQKLANSLESNCLPDFCPSKYANTRSREKIAMFDSIA